MLQRIINSIIDIFKWGVRHRRIAIKVYTFCCIAWISLCALIALACITSPSYGIVEKIGFTLTIFLIFILPPTLPLYVLYRKEMKAEPKRALLMDPYLISARDKMIAAKEYLKGKITTWAPLVTLAHDALLSAMQRLIIELKGVEGIKILEELSRQKQLYLEKLIRILRELNAIDDEEVKELEILRHLRNKVVHEDYHPTKEQALWAYNVVRKFISKRYPYLLK